MGAPQLAPEPAPLADDAAILAPPHALMGVKDIAPDPGYGMISGDRASGYNGGWVCPKPDCLTLVKVSGRFVPEEDSMTGAFIELTTRGAGVRCEGEIRGRWIRFKCPRCGRYQQLALDVVSREPAFVAVFVRKTDGGTP